MSNTKALLAACAALALTFGATIAPANAERMRTHHGRMMHHERMMMHHDRMMMRHDRMRMHHRGMMHRRHMMNRMM